MWTFDTPADTFGFRQGLALALSDDMGEAMGPVAAHNGDRGNHFDSQGFLRARIAARCSDHVTLMSRGEIHPQEHMGRFIQRRS